MVTSPTKTEFVPIAPAIVIPAQTKILVPSVTTTLSFWITLVSHNVDLDSMKTPSTEPVILVETATVMFVTAESILVILVTAQLFFTFMLMF